MIPIRDTTPVQNRSIVNPVIIALNILVFLAQSSDAVNPEQFIYIYGLVPARYSVSEFSSYFSFGYQLFSFFSFMFLHGGFLHLLGNMWSLYIFGNNVEDHLGPLRYLAFYLLCGVASGVSHLFLNFYSNIPVIGASGAIAGVMGAYLILYPHAKILALFPIIIIPYFVEIPAFVFLGLWFILQLFNATSATTPGIAWWAHVGGFIFGILFLKMFAYLPGMGVTKKLRPVTARKTSHRLQVIHPTSSYNDSNLYGNIYITHPESVTGANKLVNIPWSYQQRLFRVQVPPGVSDNQTLRLKGMGKAAGNHSRGDLLLKVNIQ